MENLREVATVYLPRMANDYTGLTSSLRQTTGTDGAFDRSGEFGAQEFKAAWTALRDLIWTSSDQTSDNLYALGVGLKSAVDEFCANDEAAAAAMDAERATFEGKNGPSGLEWNQPYGNDENAPPLVVGK
ncbi:hypothetical protein Snas_2018 [Stackebrandtia nassauensis DSM 44728]|uniref:Uncharacterized protein n=1 Tax=Stackebrandtia nassauensis (strain DSM 44728 / CIP 108903 / NRRL B-16338 / NBRC 102104 / LLR-40K-21) TaxID=446470 RepID=D3Q0H7_STANL|nr:hypothetical protein Snas_2018 [Stackebrandtia nassauensis DSM 44728]